MKFQRRLVTFPKQSDKSNFSGCASTELRRVCSPSGWTERLIQKNKTASQKLAVCVRINRLFRHLNELLYGRDRNVNATSYRRCAYYVFSVLGKLRVGIEMPIRSRIFWFWHSREDIDCLFGASVKEYHAAGNLVPSVRRLIGNPQTSVVITVSVA